MAGQPARDKAARAAPSGRFVASLVLGLVSFVVIGLGLAFVVPRFEAVLRETGLEAASLPQVTVVLFAVSRWFRRLWFLAVPVLPGLALLAARVPRRRQWIVEAALALVLGAIAAFMVVGLFSVRIAMWRQLEPA